MALGAITGFAGGTLDLSTEQQTVILTLADSSATAGPKTVTLLAVGQPTTAGSYSVSVELRDSGDGVVEVATASSPFLLTARAPVALQLQASSSWVIAGDDLPLRVTSVDSFGNSSPVASGQILDLLSDNSSGSYRLFVGGPAVTSASLAADSSGVDLFYRATQVASGSIGLTVVDGAPSAPDLGFAQASVTLLPSQVDSQRSSVTATSPVVADGSDVSAVTLVLRDEFGNILAGVDSSRISASLDAPSFAVVKLSAATAADGSFPLRLSSLFAGSWTLQVTVDASTLADQPLLEYTVRPIDGTQSTMSAGPAGIADGSDSIEVDLQLRDTNGLAVSAVDSASIVFTVLGDGLALEKLAPSSALDGSFTALLRTTLASTRRLAVTVGGVALSDTLQLDFLAGPVDPDRSSVALSGPALADGVDFVTLDTTLRDAYDNPIADLDSAQIAISASAVSVEKTASSTALDGSFSARLRSTGAGARPVNVTAAGIPLSAQPSAVFNAAGPDSTHSSLVANSFAVADGVDTIDLVLTLRDAFDNPVAGVDSARIDFAIPSPWQLTKLDASTDAAGEFHASLRSLLAGTGQVQARLDGAALGSSLMLQFVSGPLDHFAVNLPGGSSAIAGVPLALEILALDSTGNRLTGYGGTMHVQSTSSGSGSNLNWASSGAGTLTSLPAGEADYSFAPVDSGRVVLQFQDTLAESLSVIVSDASASGSAGLVILPAAASALELVDGDGQSATVGTNVAQPLRTRAVDAFGNPVSGAMVEFAAADGGRVDVDPVLPGDQTTSLSDSLGIAACPVWQLGPVAGPQSLSTMTSFAPPLTFDATAIAGAVSTLVLAPTGPRSLQVNALETVAALASDSFGNPVSGVEVSIFVSDALDGTLASVGETDSLGIASQRGLTGADGLVHVLYRAPSVAGLQDVLDAAASGIPSGTVADLIYTSVVGNPVALALSLPSGGVTAGVEGSFSLALVDTFANLTPAASATVTVHADPATGLGFSSVSGGPYLDTLNLPVTGQATVYFQGGPAGIHAFAVSDSASVLLGDAGNLEILASATVATYQLSYPSTATAGTVFSLNAEAFDAFGNPAVAAADSFTLDLVDGADSTLVVPLPLGVSAGQLVQGSYSTSFERINQAGAFRIRLNAKGSGFTGPLLSVSPAGAYELVTVGPDSLSQITAGSSVDLTVEVLDAWGNAVSGETLNVVQLVGGVLESSPPLSSGAGLATFTLRTNAIVGTARLRISILDGTPTGRETALFLVETVAGPIASLSVNPSLTNVTAGQSFSFSVTALDGAGNQVLAAADSLQLSDTGTGVSLSPVSGPLSAGLFTSSARDTLSEVFSIGAALKSQPAINTQSPPITVGPGAAMRLVAVGDTLQTAAASSDVILHARVVDAYGNPVPSVPVHLSLSSSPQGASIEDPDPPADDGLASTDSNGELAFVLHLSALSGDHRVKASILDGLPADLETVRWTVQGTPGSANHLEFTIADSVLTAGIATQLEIRAKDSAGNDVDVSGELAFVSVPAGVSVQPSPASLANGSATVALSAFVAGPLAIDVSLTASPSVAGSLSGLAVVAAAPSGTIAVPVIDPPANTANGLSVTRLNAGPIRDAFSNLVALGTAVDVAASGGTIISDDLDPALNGIQRLTDASGMVDLRLVSPLSAGTVNVSFVSGSATGSADATFEARASLSADGALAPGAAVPGQAINFSISFANAGGVDAILDAALSELRIEDGQGGVLTAPLLSDTVVGASSTQTLVFATATLPASFALGGFRPTLTLMGQDSHSQAVSAFVVLPQGSFLVSALALRGVAHETQAAAGDTLHLRVSVENIGAGAVEISQLAVQSSPAGDFSLVGQDPLPVLAAGSQTDLLSRWLVGSATAPGSYRFVARVTGRVAGVDFAAPVDSSAVALVVSSASSLELVAGSVSPALIHHGATLLLKVRVKNNGGATVALNPQTSSASFGGGLWSGALTAPTALAPGQEAELSFGPTTVDAALGSQSHDLRLHLEGTENSFAFQADLLAATAIATQTPADLALQTPALDPAAALRGSVVGFTLALQNLGEAEVELDPLATRLALGEPGGQRISALLSASSDQAVSTGAHQLVFSSLNLPADLTLGTPEGTLELRGTQNGLPYSLNLALPIGTLFLQDPSGLRIFSTVALNPRVPRPEVDTGQLIPVRVVVGNNAGEAIDSLTVRLTGSAAPASAAADILIPRLQSSEVDTLIFPTTLTSSPGPESLRASIVRALSSTTGQLVVPQSPLDDLANLVVQSPVSLAFEAALEESTDPLSMRVTPGQIFSVRIAIVPDTSVESSGTWLPVDVDLSGLQGFSLNPPSSLPVQLDPNNPEASIELVAPSTAQTVDLLAALSRVDLDANDPDARPLTTASSRSLQVEVFGGGSFDLCGLSIVTPQGALDGVVSTGQRITLEGEVDGPSNLEQRALELLLPPQLALVGGTALQPLADGQTKVSWELLCPETPISGLVLRTVAHATDVQSGSVLADTCATASLDIVQAARAAPRLSVLEPNSARDRGELPPGAVVELRGEFALSGSAGVTGPARLHLEVPAGFTILDGQAASIDLGDPSDQILWRVQGPTEPGFGSAAASIDGGADAAGREQRPCGRESRGFELGITLDPGRSPARAGQRSSGHRPAGRE